MTLFFAKGSGKYFNVKTSVDGYTFSSKREANRYCQLKILARVGEIDELELQPRFALLVNGHKVCTYIGDFRYRLVSTGASVVEDVKSKATRTPIYLLKRKLMRAILKIEIVEIA